MRRVVIPLRVLMGHVVPDALPAVMKAPPYLHLAHRVLYMVPDLAHRKTVRHLRAKPES